MSTANESSASAASASIKKIDFELKTPKGTRDFGPYEMAIRERVFSILTKIFKRHGGVTIETPVFELKEVLSGKYGEDSKLIYDLQDQGGELCSLRYDLTVPFARYLAMNKNIKTMKRYQIAKVYRRDQPALNRGRYREFYQCDLDIAGAFYEPLVPDAEIFKIAYEGLSMLLGGSQYFTIRCNNRKILDGLFIMAGVPEDKLRPICSAVDKLDKISWEEVKKEMVEVKGLCPKVADKIGEYVRFKGGKELVDQLLASELACNASAKAGLEEMKTLFEYLEIYQVLDAVQFDMSLARGLDYYTGVIFEAVVGEGDVGTVFAGGRYDNLVGMFSKSGENIPCVGGSFGVERLFTILEARVSKGIEVVRQHPVDVFVAAVGGDLLEERMRVTNQLWDASINAEFTNKRKVKALDQFAYCEKNEVPLIVLLGPEELAAGKVKLRLTTARAETTIELCNLVEEVKNKLAQLEVESKLGSLNI